MAPSCQNWSFKVNFYIKNNSNLSNLFFLFISISENVPKDIKILLDSKLSESIAQFSWSVSRNGNAHAISQSRLRQGEANWGINRKR